MTPLTITGTRGETNEHISKETAETLEDDLKSVVEWGQKWMVTFNAAKTKRVSFNNYKNPSLPPIAMAKNTLPESTSFKLLGLTFKWNMNWNRYIENIAKAAARKVGSLSTVLENYLRLKVSCTFLRPPSAHVWSTVVTFGLVHLLLVSHSWTGFKRESPT